MAGPNAYQRHGLGWDVIHQWLRSGGAVTPASHPKPAACLEALDQEIIAPQPKRKRSSAQEPVCVFDGMKSASEAGAAGGRPYRL